MTIDQVLHIRNLAGFIEYQTLADGTRLDAHQVLSGVQPTAPNSVHQSRRPWLYFHNGILVKARGHDNWPTQEELDYSAQIAMTGAEPSL